MVKIRAKQQLMVNGKWLFPGDTAMVSESTYRDLIAAHKPESLEVLSPLREVIGAEPIAEETKAPPATSSKKRVVSSEPKSS